MPFFVYILECSDKTFYCGYTKNLDARILAHSKGRGAKYTRSRRPVKLIYSEKKRTIRGALRREIEIKKMTRKNKEKLAEFY